MLQQLVITTHNKDTLKPLLESAIQAELKTLEAGLRQTRQRLEEFEQRFGMSTVDFERRLSTRELEETLEYIEWRMELGMLRLLEKQHQTLREARLD